MRPSHLLGRHVVERAHDLVRTGQCEVSWRQADDLRQAEVGDLHAAFPIQQDVLRLDVAVHHAFVVSVLEGIAYLWHNLERRGRRKFARLD